MRCRATSARSPRSTNCTLTRCLHDAAEDDHIHLQPLDFPVPVHGSGDRAQAPRRRAAHVGDPAASWSAEDPCLKVEHVVNTNETVVYGLGELHLRMLLERLREVYKLRGADAAAAHRLPRDDHRRTAEGHHRHKKQTGGAGQFGEVFLRVEPLPRGAGFEFVDAGQGRHDPGPVHPGGREGRARGADARRDRRLPGGRRQASSSTTASTTRVDSKEIAFVTAGRKAFMAAVREGAADRARADRQRRDHRARRARWATSPATCRPSAARSAARANGAMGAMIIAGAGAVV